MYEYRQVLVRMRQGDTDRAIARSGLMGRVKAGEVRRVAQGAGWLDLGRPLPEDGVLAQRLRPRPLRRSTTSSLEPFRVQVEAWRDQGLQGTTIHGALVRRHGFAGSYSAVRRFLAELGRGEGRGATVILDFAPGETAQVDFGQGPKIEDPELGEISTWVFVMTLCWSRHQYAEVVRDQTVETWLGCHRRAFESFGGVPRRLIIDNPKCAITRACARDPEVQRAYGELAEGYGFRIDPCPPRDPQKKGRVEAGVKYIKRSFLPLRDFRSLADANRQLADWVAGQAGHRLHGTHRQRPLGCFVETERALLLPLPDRSPEPAAWAKVQVGRNGHVQHARAHYSVPFRLLGQTLWLRATASTVQVYDDHLLVASHPRMRPGEHSTLEDHLPLAARAFREHDPAWCREQAASVGPACAAVVEQLLEHPILDKLRAAQSVVRLAERFGASRAELACQRALDFGDARYRTVKTILERGLDVPANPEPAFDRLADAYRGAGRFCRDTRPLLVH
ncbi:MAG TPA: IS21 family transposase [Thermoanaerobaculia bacterium]|nr:IS21 family transposase [Thermoanaerobaculia bacterium]